MTAAEQRADDARKWLARTFLFLAIDEPETSLVRYAMCLYDHGFRSQLAAEHIKELLTHNVVVTGAERPGQRKG